MNLSRPFRFAVACWIVALPPVARASAQAPLVDLLTNPSAGTESLADGFVRSSVRVEVVVPRERLFIGETVEVAVRVWLEREFADSNLLQLSARQLDAPIQVLSQWLQSGYVPPPDDEASATVALGDRAVRALRLTDREYEQRRYAGFELRAALRPQQAGALEIDSPRLRLVYATQFRSTLLDDREPTDSRIVSLAAQPLTVTVSELPAERRPVEFNGAIGRFELTATVDRDTVTVGESFRLIVAVRGVGNFMELEPPQVERSANFQLIGQLARRDEDGLSVTYDLAPLSRAVFQTPAVTLAYFDPEPPESYRKASAPLIPLRVRVPVQPALGSPEPIVVPGVSSRGVYLIAALFALSAVGVAVAIGLWIARNRPRRSH